MEFYKYQGTGNDFVMIDNRSGEWNDLSIPDIQKLCDRRFGIGADGLIKINTAEGYDFEVDYYNSDIHEESEILRINHNSLFFNIL